MVRLPPAGPVISTYFHYNDLRRMWPRRLGRVHFVTISPDPALVSSLAGARRVLVCEHDESTAEALTADLVALLGEQEVRIEQWLITDPAATTLDRRKGSPILFSPRVWAGLPESVRSHRRAVEFRYVLDAQELQAIAGELGWLRARRRRSVEIDR